MEHAASIEQAAKRSDRKRRGKEPPAFGDAWVAGLQRRQRPDDQGNRTGPQLDRDTIPDPGLTVDRGGHWIRISRKDAKSYVCHARRTGGSTLVWATIGNVGTLRATATDEERRVLGPEFEEIQLARSRARAAIERMQLGLPVADEAPAPLPSPKPAARGKHADDDGSFEAVAARDPDSFDGVALRYLAEEAGHFTRAAEYERIFKQHCHPAFGARPFVEVRRGDVSKLIDAVCVQIKGEGSNPEERERDRQRKRALRLNELEALRADPKSVYWRRDAANKMTGAAKAMQSEYRKLRGNGGARMADSIASKVHALQKWFADLEDNDELDYAAPALCRKRNKTPKTRDALTRAEIRALWGTTSNSDTFGAILRMLLLTGQRLAKVKDMAWSDINLEAGTWTVPHGGDKKREKSVGGLLALPLLAMEILRERRKLTNGNFVFPGRSGDKPFAGIKTAQRTLDKRLTVARSWSPHWLRHTASTLMAEAGVRPDIKELTLGHSVKGVEGRYDHSELIEFKRDALAKLAASVEKIVGLAPSGENAIQLHHTVG